VAKLEARLRDPVLQPAVERLRASAGKSAQMQIEWDALHYLITKDRAAGRATVEAALAFLKKSELPDKQDACRVTGRAMVTGAIAYDWLYALLTPEERQAFVKELVRLAKTLECGYPPTRGGSVTGHASEAMIMRDLLSAGIAIYDEFPEMYELAAGRFFREHLPARNWLYNGHADPAFRKTWLLHTQEEPMLGSAGAAVDCTRPGEGGRLNLDVLLPEPGNLDLATAGGPGKEFWVAGENYANDVEPAALKRNSMELGAWRVEVSPKAAAADDLFLNVMQVTDGEGGARWPVSKLEADGRVGCLIASPAASWLVLFRRDSARSDAPVRFTVPGAKPCRVLVADLEPGAWSAQRAGEAASLAVTASDESGALWFEAPPGDWVIRRLDR
jgi:hypothetical protein